MAQQLDLTPAQTKPETRPVNVSSPGTPFMATVTKTLYLPPAMYGHWSVTGTLVETNTPDLFSPVVKDIWVMERVGDEVMISNPANGASATIHVDEVVGDRAIFHRTGVAGKGKIYSETPTLTVIGDTILGESMSRIEYIKDGRITRAHFARYKLKAKRITDGRIRFTPQEGGAGADPDFTIEDVKPGT